MLNDQKKGKNGPTQGEKRRFLPFSVVEDQHSTYSVDSLYLGGTLISTFLYFIAFDQFVLWTLGTVPCFLCQSTIMSELFVQTWKHVLGVITFSSWDLTLGLFVLAIVVNKLDCILENSLSSYHCWLGFALNPSHPMNIAGLSAFLKHTLLMSQLHFRLVSKLQFHLLFSFSPAWWITLYCIQICQ